MKITRFETPGGNWLVTVSGIDVPEGTEATFYLNDGSVYKGVVNTPQNFRAMNLEVAAAREERQIAEGMSKDMDQ